MEGGHGRCSDQKRTTRFRSARPQPKVTRVRDGSASSSREEVRRPNVGDDVGNGRCVAGDEEPKAERVPPWANRFAELRERECPSAARP